MFKCSTLVHYGSKYYQLSYVVYNFVKRHKANEKCTKLFPEVNLNFENLGNVAYNFIVIISMTPLTERGAIFLSSIYRSNRSVWKFLMFDRYKRTMNKFPNLKA